MRTPAVACGPAVARSLCPRAARAATPLVAAPRAARAAAHAPGAALVVEATTSTVQVGTQGVGTLSFKKGRAGGKVFVVGGAGQTSGYIIRELIKSGSSVVAAVADINDARIKLDFVKRLEVISKDEASKIQLVELESLDADDIAVKIPRGAKVIACLGDELASNLTVGSSTVTNMLAAADAAGAASVTLVEPCPFDGGFFGFGGGPKKSLTPLERSLAESGMPYAVIRHANFTEEGYRAPTTVNTIGSLPAEAKVTRTQVAEIVVAALGMGEPELVVEVSSSVMADVLSPTMLLNQAIEGQYSPRTIEEPAESTTRKPGTGFSLGGTKMMKRQAEEATGEEQEEEVVEKTGTSFLGDLLGTLKVKAPKSEEK